MYPQAPRHAIHDCLRRWMHFCLPWCSCIHLPSRPGTAEVASPPRLMSKAQVLFPDLASPLSFPWLTQLHRQTLRWVALLWMCFEMSTVLSDYCKKWPDVSWNVRDWEKLTLKLTPNHLGTEISETTISSMRHTKMTEAVVLTDYLPQACFIFFPGKFPKWFP